MENVVLVIHLLLALALIGVVLLQRSEGGGLGLGGGGGGGGGLVSSRGAATALGKITWALAVAFIATSLTLTIIAAQNAADSSVLDRLGAGVSEEDRGADPLLPPAGALLPPPAEDGGAGTGVPLPRAE
ncbi:MAG: preprotein translocase subunit SecG [Paracoccaceae bacterium]|nr:preprotein translocase subunit SecG [Paracoccaceae bacterium]